MKSFADKVAVITGAASGIGAALAHKCALTGMKVVLADINVDRLNDITNQLKKINDSMILPVVTNVALESDVVSLAQKTIEHFGKVNLLFNNAGIGGPLGAIWEVNEKDLQKVINTNLMSVIYGLRTFIPIMLSNKEDCYIVNTASGAGLHTAPNMSGYILTKHAIVALSEVLFFDLEQRHTNIHVSVLCPGAVKSNLIEGTKLKVSASKEIKQLANFLKTSVSMGMSPEEVADQVFLAIRKKQFYILTHFNDHKELIKDRIDNILHLRNPTNPMQE